MEIEKARKKMEKAGEVVSRQRKILDDAGYQAKVSENLKEGEKRKLRDAEAEVAEIERSLEEFEKLKLE